MSHEGVIYCKPHHKELFQPKAVIMDILDDKRDAKAKKTQDIIGNCLYNFRVKYPLLKIENSKANFFYSFLVLNGISDFHKEQERRMETIVRENDPIDLGDEVIKCKITIWDRLIS